MSDNQQMGFGKFVPGFDFLQNLAKGASQTLPQMPNLSNWVAPTLNVEELDKRIGELKAVHFWLDQNSKALGATIQALEVQKMTLATLKGMNFNMGDVANALKLKAADTVMSGVQMAAEKVADTANALSGESAASTPARKKGAAKSRAAAQAGVVDPLQWWGALTQQFQEIASTAMKDAATQTAVHTAKNVATGVAKGAYKTATGMAKAAGGSVAAGARKQAAKRTARKA
ncbi:PhaM family polyhydroxyalkanoate granule multifunctional regulatory protein [Caenimonas sp. SL110]|uniref:PhaM family polyhydroxyalkanoate granule multifunctional regulatory protein n=1 Tax=Caenimonas sp. SL110 TaxID=1450524 RepID=UPI00065386DA|nr:PhaM family polyhydroxyalkanoate granule multifunctional regulatory protein [Caenimonas sp. SL110]